MPWPSWPRHSAPTFYKHSCCKRLRQQRIVTGSALLVTMCAMPKTSASYPLLLEVLSPSDELLLAHLIVNNRAMRFVHLPVPQDGPRLIHP
jgi:hypothetical protein